MRIALVCLGLITTQAYAQESPASVLEHCCSLSTQDLKSVNEGHALGRLMKFGGDRDIAIMGAIRLGIPKEAYIDWWRRIENYTYSPMVMDVGAFHIPPQPEDLARMTLDENHLKQLEECEPGKCGIKLTKEEIAESKAEVHWHSPTSKAEAETMVRTFLLRHVAEYMKQGDAALPTYHDKPEELDVRATFRSLLEASPYLKTAFPSLYAKLSDFHGIQEDSPKDDMIYWSWERYGFGLKPLLNVLHVTLFKPSPAVAVIATKQIWASHYYDGSLGITVLVDANPGTYLVYLNRSRIDLLRDAGVKMWFVKRFAPGTIRKEITALKHQVEENPDLKTAKTH